MIGFRGAAYPTSIGWSFERQKGDPGGAEKVLPASVLDLDFFLPNVGMIFYLLVSIIFFLFTTFYYW